MGETDKVGICEKENKKGTVTKIVSDGPRVQVEESHRFYMSHGGQLLFGKKPPSEAAESTLRSDRGRNR